MKKILYIIIIINFSCKFTDCQWKRIETGTSANLTSVKFIDQLTGWIAGDGGSIFKTTNGGNKWSFQNPSLPYNFEYTIGAILNSNSGFITGTGINSLTNTYLTTSNSGIN